MSSSGILDPGNDLHKECLWFCFYHILNEDLQKAKISWNSHHIRLSRHDCVSVSLDILFSLPERSGGVDNLQIVSNAKMVEMELQHLVNDMVEDDYQECFHYLMENEGIQYPTSPEEAFKISTSN
jgi:hypothetical protein